MSKTNKTVEKTIVDADKIAQAMMEGSHKQLRSILEESIANLIKEGDEKTDDPEEDASKETEDNSYEVEDVDTDSKDSEDDSEKDDDTSEEDGGKTEDGGADDEWSELSDYKVKDDGEDYDFTGADGETILKAYSKLGDNDEIVVTKDEDGNIELKDGEAGTEYVIELNPEGMDDNSTDGADEFELELGGDVEDDGEAGDDLDINLDGITDDTEGDEDEFELELNEENLGYTTEYQDPVFTSGVMAGKRNYGRKGASEPFSNEVNECGTQECGTRGCGNMEESMTLRKSYKTKRVNKAPETHKDYVAEPKDATLDENKRLKAELRRICEAAKKIQAENKQYKANNVELTEGMNSIKKSLYEAAVVNKNLGRIVNLFVNETTTREEKNEILESFNNVKTLKEGERLYESYRQKLSGKTQKTAIMERTISMDNHSLNETTIYTQKNPSLDLMSRMDNLYKR